MAGLAAAHLPASHATAACPMGAATEGGDWRLLMGPGAIKPVRDVKMIPEPVQKAGPFLGGDLACGQNPYVFGTLAYDPARCVFRLWYQTYNRGAQPRTAVMYAESENGRKWSFPVTSGRCSRGPASNVVLEPGGPGDLYSPSVVIDPDDVPDRRYKMAYSDFTGGKDTYTHGGVCVAFSRDGVTWSRHQANPVLPFRKQDRAASDVVDVTRNPRTGEFELYAKGWTGWRDGSDGVSRPRYRTVVRSVSRDFLKWSEPEIVVNHRFDNTDPQSYGMPVSFIGDLHVGLLRSYKLPGDSTIDVRLMVSRDGRRWSYPAGERSFIGLGKAGSFDSGMIMTTPLITVGATHYAVAGGWTGSHEDPQRRSSLGLVTMKRHRFIGISGQFDTALLPRKATSLKINALARDPVTVQAVDARGNALPLRFSPLQGDSLEHNVQPAGGAWPDAPFALRLAVPATSRVFAYAAG